MMVVDPAATAVTSPVLLTVATPVLEEVQGVTAAGVTEPESWEVNPAHAEVVPEMVGKALTMKVAVTWQPLLLV